MVRSIDTKSMYITGLAHEYPSYSFGPEDFESLITRLYPDHATSLGYSYFPQLLKTLYNTTGISSLQRLIHLNRKTQIQSRRSVLNILNLKWIKDDATLPSIDEISRIYRSVGVNLTAKACGTAMQEARVSADDITHVVGVTCTDQGNPGYDLLVCQELKLSPTVQRVLLHGVGCAGGLSALRVAANIAAAETQKGRPARVLVMACELCSLFLTKELHVASQDEALHVAPAIFSDGAAALVLCNSIAMGKQQKPIFDLLECGSMVVPGTTAYMAYDIEADGMSTLISSNVMHTYIQC
jgi:type III polyketide synthase